MANCVGRPLMPCNVDSPGDRLLADGSTACVPRQYPKGLATKREVSLAVSVDEVALNVSDNVILSTAT